MGRLTCALLLVLGATVGWSRPSVAADKNDKKGAVVELDGLKSAVPADWKQENTNSQMRAFQFRIPHVAGDKNDAELVIFYFGQGGGGSVEDNIKRWKGLFTPAEGKTADNSAKTEKLKVGDVPVTYLDVQGTYLFKTRPFDPNDKGEKRPDYRMFGVVFESANGPYFIRFVGPAKTVGENKKGFDDWLKSFK